MIGRTTAEAVLLDHNYCVPVGFDKEIQATFPSIMVDDGSTLSWEKELGIEFDPPRTMNLQSNSTLSPSHSVDSGFDNELFADLDLYYLGKNFEPGMDTLFSEEEASEENATKKPSQTLPYTTTASTSTATDPSTETKRWKVSPRQKKMMENRDIDEEEKNRKNAIAARENRQKKKRYVESIEKQNEELKRENEILKAKDKNHSKTVEKLENEVSYLRNVIANQSTLSALLKSVVSTPGISFTSSFTPQEPAPGSMPTIYDNDADDDDKTDNDDDTRRYKTRGSKKRKLDAQAATPPSTKKQCADVKGGICLHLNQDKVSLEFCQECSIKAQGIGHE